MKEQLLRLRYKGEIVGYLFINHLNIGYSEDMKVFRGLYHIYTDHFLSIQNGVIAPDLPRWDSFDLSLKQGDEWFFEGDEVRHFHWDGTELDKGWLEFKDNMWMVINEIGCDYVESKDTLKLIKRAV